MRTETSNRRKEDLPDGDPGRPRHRQLVRTGQPPEGRDRRGQHGEAQDVDDDLGHSQQSDISITRVTLISARLPKRSIRSAALPTVMMTKSTPKTSMNQERN